MGRTLVETWRGGGGGGGVMLAFYQGQSGPKFGGPQRGPGTCIATRGGGFFKGAPEMLGFLDSL